ncbi:hypothetical protein [Deinococcus sp. QL22]|uniref:hypothetical protein n=1 Tax=Deinococcus sp. QL22 TaxID=2939437 RepID=UPI002017ACD0|nr:hypothetical protein [Deinococcus sp. QL22]UQN07080.1 hypothetical protein M1R55_03995 [Deinococcus sp. QL22]
MADVMESSETSLKIREDLCNIFPTFTDWLSEDSIFYSEGREGQQVFGECSVFLELTHFLAAKLELWHEASLQALAALLEGVLTRPADELYGAVEICFLDTVGGYEAFAGALRPHLQARSGHVFELDSSLSNPKHSGAT